MHKKEIKETNPMETNPTANRIQKNKHQMDCKTEQFAKNIRRTERENRSTRRKAGKIK